MPWTTVDRINTWLEPKKTSVNDVPQDLELAAKDQVFARMALSYDVTGWTDSGSTPSLVQGIMAMYIAAWFYQRVYSQDADLQAYAMWIINQADILVKGIVSGILDLIDVAGAPPTKISKNDFYPNDDTEILDPEQAAKFTMGKLF